MQKTKASAQVRFVRGVRAMSDIMVQCVMDYAHDQGAGAGGRAEHAVGVLEGK